MQRLSHWTTALMLAICTLCGPSEDAAASIQVDFETVPGVSPTISFGTGTTVAPGQRLTTQLAASHGVAFSSTPGYVALVGLGSGHATSGSQGIGSVSSSHTLSYSEPLVVTFSMPGDPSTPAVTDFVSIRGDQMAVPGTATLEAFDINNASLGTVMGADVLGGLTLSLSVANIHSIRLTQSSGSIAYDDLVFNDLRPASGAIPEPSTGTMAFFMMLAVVGGAWRWCMRR